MWGGGRSVSVCSGATWATSLAVRKGACWDSGVCDWTSSLGPQQTLPPAMTVLRLSFASAGDGVSPE